MSRVFSLLGALALGSSLALPAMAEPRASDPLRSQTVGLSDLDLRSESGAAIAVSRLSFAAKAVCDEYQNSVRDLGARSRSQRCHYKAMDSAVTRLDSPGVSAAHFGRRVHVQVIASVAAAPGR